MKLTTEKVNTITIIFLLVALAVMTAGIVMWQLGQANVAKIDCPFIDGMKACLNQ